jgi:carbonic anhydrase
MLLAHQSKTLLLLSLITTLLIAVPIAAQAPATGGAHSWSYSGDQGPENWGSKFATCGIGKDQSPIDIVDPKVEKLPKIMFSYHPSPLSVINNGHTIQVNYRHGSTIVRDGKTYELVQFHFHHLSENAINGTHTPMELHLVHRAEDGSLAVVAVMLKEGGIPIRLWTWSGATCLRQKTLRMYPLL